MLWYTYFNLSMKAFQVVILSYSTVNMNVNFGFPSMTVETSVDDDFHGQAHAQVSFPGMSMNMKME